jgi:lysylphosphatidylglycerol synthetase-like protein (DUF2156 family)
MSDEPCLRSLRPIRRRSLKKKTSLRKLSQKTNLNRQSITTTKSYWITLTLLIVVFAFVFGYFVNLSLDRIVIMLAAVLFVIGFARYIRVKPSTTTISKRATFFFVGASIIGFSIWAVMVLSLNVTGLHPQVASVIGDGFFAITSLIICLISGAVIGDLIGTNGERISIFIKNKLRK